MGTVPYNFPPQSSMGIGGTILTGVSLGNTGPLATTVFFTAPVRGLYQVVACVVVTQTDGAGAMVLTIGMPPLPNLPTVSTPVTSDIASAPRIGMMEAGAQVTLAVTQTGVVATTFDVYLSATRAF